MKVLVLADSDAFGWEDGPGEADVVISCGDLVDDLLLDAAFAHDCRTILAVKGNHDAPTPFPDSVVDLHLRVVEVGGLRFGGLNGAWRYKPRGHFLHDQDEVGRMLADFPPVDVFVSHNSPRGIHERDDDVHQGFDALGTYLRRAAPRLLIHGHQHRDGETQLGGTRVIGVHGVRRLEL